MNTIRFQLYIAGDFSPVMKDDECRKSKMYVKLIYSIKTNIIINFFSEYLVKFLRNCVKYVVSRVVLDVVLSALKVAL